jgi:hypothetical protein
MLACVTVHGRTKTFLESCHSEITVFPVTIRQLDSAWVVCVLPVENTGTG